MSRMLAEHQRINARMLGLTALPDPEALDDMAGGPRD